MNDKLKIGDIFTYTFGSSMWVKGVITDIDKATDTTVERYHLHILACGTTWYSEHDPHDSFEKGSPMYDELLIIGYMSKEELLAKVL